MDAPEPLREGTVVLRDRRHIGWAEFGDPQGVPVLWFHGTPGGRRQIPPTSPALAIELGIRIVGVERPGIGDSTHDPKRTLLSWASDVREVVDHLGIDRFGVAGLSGGGPHVLAVAHEMPERVFGAAVLGGLAPVVGDEAASGYFFGAVGLMQFARYVRAPLGEVLSVVLQSVRPYVGRFGTTIFDVLLRVWPKADRPHFEMPGMQEMFLADIIGSTEHGIRSLVHDLSLFGMSWGFSLTDIKVPVHIWHADADVTVPIQHGEMMHARIPGSELTVVADEGHFAGFVRPEDVFAWLLTQHDATV